MNELQTKLRFILKLSAILGAIPALWFSIVMAGFASDGPNTPWWIPVLIFILFLAITFLPTMEEQQVARK